MKSIQRGICKIIRECHIETYYAKVIRSCKLDFIHIYIYSFNYLQNVNSYLVQKITYKMKIYFFYSKNYLYLIFDMPKMVFKTGIVYISN